MNKGWSVLRILILAAIALVNWLLVVIVISLVAPNWAPLLATVILAGLILAALTPFGEVVLQKLHGMRRLTGREERVVREAFNEVLASVSMEKGFQPTLLIVDDAMPNAMALGRRTVAVTTGLLQGTPEMIRGVLAHEIGHLVHHDSEIAIAAVVMNSVGRVASWIIFTLLTALAVISAIFERSGFGILISLIMALFIWFLRLCSWVLLQILNLSFLAVGRRQELAADEFAVSKGFGPGLLSFLEAMQGLTIKHPETLMARLAASHPSHAVRIDYIERLLGTVEKS